MRFQKNHDGSYVVMYDGSKKELQQMHERLYNLSLGAKDEDINLSYGEALVITFNGLTTTFNTPNELSYWACGISHGLAAPFVEKMETHISKIVDSVYDLGKIEEIEITEDNDDTKE